MADETILIDIEYNTEEAEKNVDDLTRSIEGLRIEQAKLREQLKRGEISQVEFAKQSEKLKTQISKESQERKSNLKILISEANSRNQLRATIEKLRKERNNLNLSTKEGAIRAAELKDTIDELDEKLKKTGTTFEQQKLNIGNYKQSILEAIEEGDLFGTLQDRIRATLQGLKASIKTVIGAFKGLKGAIAATGIGLLVIAITSLITYFKRTEEGGNKLRVIMAALGAIVDRLIGFVGSLGKGLVDAFNDPKQAAIDLWNFLKGQFLNRLEAIVNIFNKIRKFEFKGIRDDFVQLTLGIDNATEKTQEFAKSIADTVKQATKLERLRQQYRILNRQLDLSASKLENQRELLDAVADDSTISFKRQIEAAKESAKITEQIAERRQKIAQNNLKLINLELNQAIAAGKDTQDLRDQQLDALKAVEDAETNLILTRENNAKKQREIERDLFEQRLDFLIDITDNRKTQLERQISDESLALEARKELFNQATTEQERAFEQQIKLFEDYTGQRIDFNSLLAEDDIERLNERLENDFEFNEITKTRLLEVLKERRTALQDFADIEKDFSKKSIENKDEEEKSKGKVSKKAREIDLWNEKTHQEKLKEIRDASIQVAQQTISSFFDFQKSRLDTQLQYELAANEGNAQKQDEIRKKFARKQKITAIAQAIISGAQAVLNALLTQPFIPAGIAAAVTAGITTGFQISKIRQQQFRLGGKVPLAKHGIKLGTFIGPSHSTGGIDLYTGSGHHVANVEGNENFYVLKKNASDYVNTLSDINIRFGGVPLTTTGRKFQEGGQVDTNQQQTTSLVRDVIRNLNVVVKVEDIKTGIEDVDNVTNVGVI